MPVLCQSHGSVPFGAIPSLNWGAKVNPQVAQSSTKCSQKQAQTPSTPDLSKAVNLEQLNQPASLCLEIPGKLNDLFPGDVKQGLRAEGSSDTQPHRKRFYEKRKQTFAFIPLAFLSLTPTLGAAINTLEKEAPAAAAFSKATSHLDTVGQKN